MVARLFLRLGTPVLAGKGKPKGKDVEILEGSESYKTHARRDFYDTFWGGDFTSN